LNARIFAVADAFDAMISDRVYRAGRSYEKAAEELDRCVGQHFDPTVVAAFHRVPREDWEELRRLSLLGKPEVERVAPIHQHLVSVLESNMNAIAV
jgi:HD-GYP domain-containing protein (c-di-GMP phosphodiesterase class II)